MLVLAFPDYLLPAQRFAASLAVEFKQVELHRFPDDESLVRLPPSLPEHVILCRSLDRPNDKLIELLLCAKTARQFGAKRITLVAPYLCYMRQDFASHPGEAISQPIIGRFLADLFDDVITVDPHLHRISFLQQAIPLTNALALSATDAIARFLKNNLDHAVLLGPDCESRQWVSAIADKTGFDYAVAKKTRRGDTRVEVSLPDMDCRNRPVIIVDDMVSTGRTIAQAAKLLQSAGAGDIYCAVTHPLFCSDAEQYILDSGVKAIWSTDSINHPTASIRLHTLLAEAVTRIR